MNSWKKKLYNYEFILWNFERFDINTSLWVKQAFEAKKYAFAADFIRFFAVYHYGGIYLDIDIEVIKIFDELLHHKIMLAYEKNDAKTIEAGCFGAEKHSPYIKECLDYYNGRHFIRSDGSFDMLPLPQIMKKQLFELLNDDTQIYTSDYFTAKNYLNGKITITNNTYCIHHFAGSWKPRREKIKLFIQKLLGERLTRFVVRLKKICSGLYS